MGVKKLSTFIESHYHWETINLFGRKLVIDGFALCYYLYFASYSSTWYFGGDYHQYYFTVRKFFDDLRHNNIDVYVVMDGIDIEQTKEATTRQRIIATNRIIAKLEPQKKSVAPLFLVHVFLDILREKQLKFYVADGEADRDIACLANHFQCPVLSADSDFYVFNLEGGFIPLTKDSRNNLTKGKPVNIFKYRKFNEQFSLVDADLILFFPFFLGNDFHRTPLLMERLGVNKKPEVDDVITYIRQFRSLDGVIADLENNFYRLEKRFEKGVQQYYRGIQVASFEDLKKPGKRLRELNHTIPRWVLIAYKRGEFHLSLMSFLALEPKRWQYRNVVEDMTQESAWEFTRDIREVIMAILTPNDGTQTVNDRDRATVMTHSDIKAPASDDSEDSDTVKEESDSKSFSEGELEDSSTSEDDGDLDIAEDYVIEAHDDVVANSNTETDKNCGTHIVEVVRAPGEYKIDRQRIYFKRGPIHNMIDYTLTWKTPSKRRTALLLIADCYEIKDQLETVPEQLQLAVIATHYWIKKKQEYIMYLEPLIYCILKCKGYLGKKKLKSRACNLRSLAHIFAHWQCSLHHMIALNQVLNQPYHYTSPAHLFSGSILHYYLQNQQKNALSLEIQQLYESIRSVSVHR